jgi:hypothetical protein
MEQKLNEEGTKKEQKRNRKGTQKGMKKLKEQKKKSIVSLTLSFDLLSLTVKSCFAAVVGDATDGCHPFFKS